MQVQSEKDQTRKGTRGSVQGGAKVAPVSIWKKEGLSNHGGKGPGGPPGGCRGLFSINQRAPNGLNNSTKELESILTQIASRKSQKGTGGKNDHLVETQGNKERGGRTGEIEKIKTRIARRQGAETDDKKKKGPE